MFSPHFYSVAEIHWPFLCDGYFDKCAPKFISKIIEVPFPYGRPRRTSSTNDERSVPWHKLHEVKGTGLLVQLFNAPIELSVAGKQIPNGFIEVGIDVQWAGTFAFILAGLHGLPRFENDL